LNQRKPSNELETRRVKRNEYSRSWKKAHKTKVQAWNKAWALEQAGDKEGADRLRSAVRGKKGNEMNSAEEGASVGVKQAVIAATKYIKSLLGQIGGLKLEEIEENKNGLGWLVTLSFVPKSEDDDLPFVIKREYKQVEINASGQPVAMRIRKVE
jgi:hypothetical protein